MDNTPQDSMLAEKLASFEAACRAHGLKLTHQRREIFLILAAATDHPSVEVIYQRLRQKMPTVSQDTVYRTLATMEQQRLVKRVESVENQMRYEVETVRHHHFVCTQCKRIIDFQWEGFDAASLPPALSGLGTILEKNVVVHGVCTACLQKKE